MVSVYPVCTLHCAEHFMCIISFTLHNRPMIYEVDQFYNILQCRKWSPEKSNNFFKVKLIIEDSNPVGLVPNPSFWNYAAQGYSKQSQFGENLIPLTSLTTLGNTETGFSRILIQWVGVGKSGKNILVDGYLLYNTTCSITPKCFWFCSLDLIDQARDCFIQLRNGVFARTQPYPVAWVKTYHTPFSERMSFNYSGNLQKKRITWPSFPIVLKHT